MGRRKRKTQAYRPIRTTPVTFDCLNCGKRAMKVTIERKKEIATIKCGSCCLEDTLKISGIDDPVDVYGNFVDKYYLGE